MFQSRRYLTKLSIALIILLLFGVGCGSETTGEPTQNLLPTQLAPAEITPSGIVPTPVQIKPSADPLVLHNGLIIDGIGGEPIPGGVVVIERGMITAVGGQDEVDIPQGSTLIDVNGGAILPGLIDAHTHLLNNIKVEDGEFTGFERSFYLENLLKAGVTTIRDVGSSWGDTRDAAELRAAIAEADNSIPNIIFTGPLLAGSESWALIDFSNQAVGLIDANAAREKTAQLLAAGVDQIKLFSDERLTRLSYDPDIPGTSLTAEQIQAVTELAHAQGVWVTMHSSIQSAIIGVNNGIDELAHWPGDPSQNEPVTLPENLFDRLVSDQIPVVSTFSIFKPAEGDVRKFLDAGGILVFGSDGPGTGPVDNPYMEMQRMTLLGEMTPMEIIVAATMNAAEAVGLGEVVGTLEVGKAADVLVVSGNPLDDLSVIRDDVTFVFKGGETVPLE